MGEGEEGWEKGCGEKGREIRAVNAVNRPLTPSRIGAGWGITRRPSHRGAPKPAALPGRCEQERGGSS